MSEPTTITTLANVIRTAAPEAVDAVGALRDAVETVVDLDVEDAVDAVHRAARTSRYLVLTLARLLEGRNVYEAFGAPGDWGYDTPIGDALSKLYRSVGADLTKIALRIASTTTGEGGAL